MMSALDIICRAIENGTDKTLILALDGRAAAGKSTLAAAVAEKYDCNVFHMDDFFLRPEQRTPERLCAAGENVDHERFLAEVMTPLRAGDAFSYRPFCCKTMSLGEHVSVTPKRINLIEGAYACHQTLFDAYTHRFFLTVAPDEQLARIARRNPDAVEMFRTRWIPLEEAYFKAYDIPARCDLIIENCIE